MLGVYLFFLFLLQTIDCSYSEAHRRGDFNVYPQFLNVQKLPYIAWASFRNASTILLKHSKDHCSIFQIM